ncbi:MAG: SprT family zinc-dependent metalloprotease [Candidatus Tectomicrobia bacterium]|uniref:SprT family zinc-dependent metalloprotease n=1 Tax=Tectimicrobiota bacterium TaxID=2528274 RepID=A0A937VWL6_UNCTE|nr:SprT family zinc-dependent metalloprotease [Candidatus Tectomicrobia bacterium]
MPSLFPTTTTAQDDRQAWLSAYLAAPVTLTWTENRSSMLSARGNATTGYQVRLHQMFQEAPASIWHALVAYLTRSDTAATQTIRRYIRQQPPVRPEPPEAPTPLLQTQGQYFDLAAMYQEINQQYFMGRVQADITWSRRPPRRQRTSMRFGSYQERDRLIRIHCLLDQSFVPRYVVEHVVFHEMLHQLIPRQQVHGRWSIHPPEFRRQERRFTYYQQAEQWQRQHLARLLRSA